MAKSKRDVAKLDNLIEGKKSVLDLIFHRQEYHDFRPTAKDLPRVNQLFTRIE